MNTELRNKRIVSMRLGHKTLQEIADHYGITRQRVDQIYRRVVPRVEGVYDRVLVPRVATECKECKTMTYDRRAKKFCDRACQRAWQRKNCRVYNRKLMRAYWTARGRIWRLKHGFKVREIKHRKEETI